MINIEEICSPECLKSMNISELNNLADKIRTYILDNVSKTGGHLSSNLGMVEATIALHYVFDSPHDKFIFDVSHQTYTHKILTGRAKDFKNLRKHNGLNGFSKYSESEHDVFEAGHSSTSIAAMCGFLEAKALGNDIGEVISIIGDGSVQNGLAFAALNYLGGQSHQKGIIILNDNGMSISKNVGGLAKILNKVRINKSYHTLKKVTPNFIKRLSSKIKKSLKEIAYGDNYFQSLGLKYIGPIDGNNIETLIKYFNYAKNNKQTTVVHIKTKKGLGYKYAEEDKVGSWHSVGEFELSSGESLKRIDHSLISWSEGISNIIFDEMGRNASLVALTPAMIYGSKIEQIKEKFPERLIDVGINEELCVEMSSTLSLEKKIPVSFIYSSFLQRAYDQLNHDIARSNLHSIVLIDRCGIVPDDGNTHQGIFDISMLSALPNYVIMMPKNLTEAYGLIRYAINNLDCPVAIRYPKELTLNECLKEDVDSLDWEIINEISDVNVITYGSNVINILENLPSNIGLINARVIKPLDDVVIKMLDKKTVYVYEEVIKQGSLGNLILLRANELGLDIKLHLISINDMYVGLGSKEELKKDLGLDIDSFIQRIKDGE